MQADYRSRACSAADELFTLMNEAQESSPLPNGAHAEEAEALLVDILSRRISESQEPLRGV